MARSSRSRGPVPAVALLLGICLIGSAVWSVTECRRLFPTRPTGFEFFDLQTIFNELARLEATGELYAVHRPGFFQPLVVGYPYPPPLAAALALAVRSSPNARARLLDEHVPWEKRQPAIWTVAGVLVSVSCLFIALGVLGTIWTATGASDRRMFLAAVALAWPHWESLTGPTLEPLVLGCLGAAVPLIASRRDLASGVLIGVAGAFKVYPWSVAILFARDRRWRGWLGVLVGGGGTLALAALILPWRLSWQYFTEVLPRMGGIALSLENIGLPGHLARLVLAVEGRLPPETELTLSTVRLLPGVASSIYSPWVTAVVAAVAGSMAWITWRASVRPPGTAEQRILTLGAIVSLIVCLFPSSWMNYQQLLLVPVILGLARARRDAPATWAPLLVAGALIRLPSAGGAIWENYPWGVAALRGLASLLVWWSMVRALARSEPRAPRAPGAIEADSPS